MAQQYKYKLAISILTRNRYSFVEELLEKLSKPLYKKNIGLYLVDGSDSNALADVVEEYRKQGLENIHYFYHSPDEYTGDKRYSGLERLHDSRIGVDAEYVWLCSDKKVPRKEYLDKVLQQLDKGYSVIVYNADPLFRRGEVTKEYFEQIVFFRECAPKLQMLMVPILHRRIIDQYTEENAKRCTDGKKYTDIEMIFRNIVDIEDFKALLLCVGNERSSAELRFETKEDSRSGHVKEARTFEYFVDKVYNTISKLPNIYNSEKKAVMKNFSCYTWFSLEGFAKLRAQGGYYFEQCFKYMDKWHLVTNVPIPIIMGISLLPPSVAMFLYKMICRYKEFRKEQHF